MWVLALYLVGVTVWGAWLGRGASGGEQYFLGGRNLPWSAVLLSVVATETSTLTFLSIPGVAYGGTMAFLQIAMGYVVGRVVVAVWLLPAYHEGKLDTAYQLLQARFGVETRRLTSAIFMITRLLADSVRLFATAIPLTLVTGWSLTTSVLVIGVVTFAYTYVGGLRAVVWVDAAQMTLYLLGGLIAAAVLGAAVPGGWGGILDQAAGAGKLSALDLSLDIGRPYTLWAGLIGGAFLTMGSHGTDQLIVQRLLACRDLKASQRALIGSGIAVLAQFALFLLVGLGLWAYYGGATFERSDEIFARFILEALPAGVRGLLIAAVFAAAMSTLSSSLNSCATAAANDLWFPIAGARKGRDVAPERRLAVTRGLTVFFGFVQIAVGIGSQAVTASVVSSVLGIAGFTTGIVLGVFFLGAYADRVGQRAALLVGAAIAFIPLSQDSAAVEVSLGIASLVYGGLLGAFALARFSKRVDGASARVGLLVGIATVTILWANERTVIAWPWFVLIGTIVTFAVGILLSARRRG